jgi:hypothetical protein
MNAGCTLINVSRRLSSSISLFSALIALSLNLLDQKGYAQPVQPVPIPASQIKKAAPVNQLKAAPANQLKPPPIKRLDNGRLDVGGVIVDRETRQVEIPAKINMIRGILEYYAVASRGKLHESVLEILSEPSHIHLALILAGFEPSQYAPYNEQMRRKPLLKRGSLLKLYVTWIPTSLNRKQWLPASSWLYNRASESAPPPVPFIFKGSEFWKNNKYAADLDRSVVGLIDDPSAVLVPLIDTGNPYKGDLLGYEVYTSAIPPKGTSVKLVIKPASKQEIVEMEAFVEKAKKLRELRDKIQALKVKFKPVPSPPYFNLDSISHPHSSLVYTDHP